MLIKKRVKEFIQGSCLITEFYKKLLFMFHLQNKKTIF